MSKKMKWLLGILAVGTFGFCISVLWIVDKLPGPTEIAHSVDKKSPQIPHETHDIGVEETKATATKTSPEAVESATDSKSQEDSKKAILSFINEDPADIRVCDNLGRGPKTVNFDNIKFDDLFAKEENRNNPIIEALRIPLKAVFQDEKVSDLLTNVMSVDTTKLNKTEKDSLLKKLGFYAKAASMATHLIGRKKDFETLADRSMHLSLISRIVSMKPELIDDPSIRGACDNLERSIIQGDKVSLKKERKEILDLIQKAGLTPKDLDFDPDSYMKFNVTFSDNNVGFTLSDKEPST